MSTESIQERVNEIISTIFSVPMDTLTSDSSPATIENWDSMGQLMLVLELEQQFGVQLSPEEVEQLSSVGVIVTMMQTREIAPS